MYVRTYTGRQVASRRAGASMRTRKRDGQIKDGRMDGWIDRQIGRQAHSQRERERERSPLFLSFVFGIAQSCT